jgi:multidrug efflux system outer membrane protein
VNFIRIHLMKPSLAPLLLALLVPAVAGAAVPTESLSYRDAAATDAPALAADWWRLFGDPELDERIERALAANRDLRGALAQVEQARAIAGVARASYLPSLTLDGGATRAQASGSTANPPPNLRATTYQAPLGLSWELDLFGRVRRLNEGARADLAAAGATYEAARLALAAEVASTHFTLRALDRELEVVSQTIVLRRDALALVQARFRSGNAGDLDVARAETELAATEADASALARQRASVNTALAVLLGEPAPAFVAGTDTALALTLPTPPPGLPSELLLRRPDLAAAAHRLDAANARIGLAKAAFFPTISLTGAAGYASADLDTLFNAGSKLWSIGPSLYLPLFQGGRNRANLERSRAAYEETLAAYEQRVLVAFGEVQDALTASRLLEAQARAQSRAVASARRGAALSQTRYDAGFVSYLEVVDAQRTALEAERAEARLAGQRVITHITLIKALGGGWSPPTS